MYTDLQLLSSLAQRLWTIQQCTGVLDWVLAPMGKSGNGRHPRQMNYNTSVSVLFAEYIQITIYYLMLGKNYVKITYLDYSTIH